MSLPVTKVELGLTLGGMSSPPFTLDSSAYGILGSNAVAGLEFFDVTEYVQKVTIVRGRSRQLDYFNAGSATIVFDNRTREFDPINSASNYYPEIKPRRLVKISSNNILIFNGFITDWDVEYDIAGNHSAVAFCSDTFSILANMSLSAVTPSAEKTGARINYVLNRSEVNYIGPRNIDTGLTDVGAYAISAGTNVLNYLRQVERSEQGALFISSDGSIVFNQRNSYDGSVVTFADDGSGLGYSALQNQYGDELLYNRITVQSPAGAAITQSDSESILDYQTSDLSWTDLLNSSTTELSNLSLYLLGNFSEPRLRFTGLRCELSNYGSDDIASILSIDLADFIELKKSFSIGSPAIYSQFSFVGGITHDISPNSHSISFNLESTGTLAVLIIGDQYFGRLDQSVLTY